MQRNFLSFVRKILTLNKGKYNFYFFFSVLVILYFLLLMVILSEYCRYLAVYLFLKNFSFLIQEKFQLGMVSVLNNFIKIAEKTLVSKTIQTSTVKQRYFLYSDLCTTTSISFVTMKMVY